ncbi:MAG TPA: hypothetical protein PKC39_13840 [Ferruginibacter sp.]|nr:hypothetical protein [Ferruginibacter sp.]HMP22038.1 hypothetical protein [Ferruginibacter sp.]
MQKPFVLLASAILLSIAGCNSSDSSLASASDDKKSDSTSDTLAIDPDCIRLGKTISVDGYTADTMIRHFKQVFHSPASPAAMKNFSDEVWIDAPVITAFADYLTANRASYDGVSMISIVADDGKTSVYLVPTKPKNKTHEKQWQNKIPVSGSYTFRYFNMDTTVVFPAIFAFRTNFRQQTNPRDIATAKQDSLSAEIWFSTCVFEILSATLRSYTAEKLDGINLLFSAYYNENPARAAETHEKYPKNQSTVILVPTTTNAQGKRENVWNAIETILNGGSRGTQKNSSSGNPPGSGINHGQICPNECGSSS